MTNSPHSQRHRSPPPIKVIFSDVLNNYYTQLWSNVCRMKVSFDLNEITKLSWENIRVHVFILIFDKKKLFINCIQFLISDRKEPKI